MSKTYRRDAFDIPNNSRSKRGLGDKYWEHDDQRRDQCNDRRTRKQKREAKRSL